MINKRFDEKQFNFFKSIAILPQDTLKKTLGGYLRKIYGKKNVVSKAEYIYATGDIPICLVAHMDTVHKTLPAEIYFDRKSDVIWSPQGLGADDRAGVFAILTILQNGLRPHVIFTTDEEKGGIGAYHLTTDYPKCPFEDIRYFIELDRCGFEDCVFYECDNESFTEYVESFGFVTDIGSFTDICEFSETWEVAGVNLSVGYFHEHTFSEMLKSSILLNTIEKVIEMLSEEIDNIPFFKFIPCKDYFNYRQYYNYGLGVCSKCGEKYMMDELVSVLKFNENHNVISQRVCGPCLAEGVNWCEECQMPFEEDPLNPDETLCPICQKKMEAKK